MSFGGKWVGQGPGAAVQAAAKATTDHSTPCDHRAFGGSAVHSIFNWLTVLIDQNWLEPQGRGMGVQPLPLSHSPSVQGLGLCSAGAPGGRAPCPPPLEPPCKPQREVETEVAVTLGSTEGQRGGTGEGLRLGCRLTRAAPWAPPDPGFTDGAVPMVGAQGCKDVGTQSKRQAPGPAPHCPHLHAQARLSQRLSAQGRRCGQAVSGKSEP